MATGRQRRGEGASLPVDNHRATSTCPVAGGRPGTTTATGLLRRSAGGRAPPDLRTGTGGYEHFSSNHLESGQLGYQSSPVP